MADGNDDFESLRTWIGRRESSHDVVTAAPVMALAATLDHAAPPCAQGDPLPPLWHWLYFLPIARRSQVGSDGHPMRGNFLPPVSLPRRMWAGSRLTFHRPVTIGERIQRNSTIADVQQKRGRTGDLVFVVVRHEIHAGTALAITEEQQIVYRAAAAAPVGSTAPADERPADWRRIVHPDPVLLFRYSALTFNGHRIHYDRPYATDEEGYPGLVVHGPLLATLLLDALHAAQPGFAVGTFQFRAQRPLFDTADFVLAGKQATDGAWSLRALDMTGAVAMEASVGAAGSDAAAGAV